MNFGRKMIAMRAIRNMSQTQVAWHSGIGYRMINQAEVGKRELAKKMQEAYNLWYDARMRKY